MTVSGRYPPIAFRVYCYTRAHREITVNVLSVALRGIALVLRGIGWLIAFVVGLVIITLGLNAMLGSEFSRTGFIYCLVALATAVVIYVIAELCEQAAIGRKQPPR